MSEQEKVLTLPQGVNFNAVLLNMNDEPFKAKDDDGGECDLRLGEVCVIALTAQLPNDKADGVTKLKRFNLAREIQGGSDKEEYAALQLSSTKKKRIEEAVAQMYSTVVYARVYEALEGNTKTDGEE